MTIIEAVLQIMRESGAAMSPRQVCKAIQERKLYTFRAQDPMGIVRTQMRRHSDGAPQGVASSTIYLKSVARDSYAVLPTPIKRTANQK
jgi:restriction system protein